MSSNSSQLDAPIPLLLWCKSKSGYWELGLSLVYPRSLHDLFTSTSYGCRPGHGTLSFSDFVTIVSAFFLGGKSDSKTGRNEPQLEKVSYTHPNCYGHYGLE